MRIRATGTAILLGLTCAAGAQSWDGSLPDADGDGHPLFGETAAAPYFESVPGWKRPVCLAFGDLNGSGHADAVVVFNGYISVLFGAGDGVFGPPTMYESDPDARFSGVALGDFDGDGDLDFAAAGAMAGAVVVFLNNGEGAFDEQFTYAIGGEPRSILSADLDGDGDTDLAVLRCKSHDVVLLYNDGSGVFPVQKSVFVGGVRQMFNADPSPAPALVAADLDGDGAVDLAVPGSGEVRLLMNDGAGDFALAQSHPKVASAYGLAAADLDGDGLIDLAAAGGATLSVCMNLGGGAFSPAAKYGLSPFDGEGWATFNTSVALGDLDGDGAPEAVTGMDLFGRYLILRNLGDGTFGPAERHDVNRAPWFVAVEDLNADGRNDVALLTPNPRGALRVRLNDGRGMPLGPVVYPPIVPPIPDECCQYSAITAADLDLDGWPDLVMAVKSDVESPRTIARVARNDGRGGFEFLPAIQAETEKASAWHLAVGDLNGDGLPDLVVADTVTPGGFKTPGTIWVVMNQGGMRFAEPVAYPLAGVYPLEVALGDLNGDERLDVAAMLDEVYIEEELPKMRRIGVMLNDGSGGLSGPVLYDIALDLSPYPRPGLGAGDVDGDGHADLVALSGSRGGPGRLTILYNGGAGGFSIGNEYTVPPQPRSVALADLNADGQLDAAVLHDHNWAFKDVWHEPYLTILGNDGKGGFDIAALYVTASALSDGNVVVTDLAGARRKGILVPVIHAAALAHLSSGGYRFDHVAGSGFQEFPRSIAVADFDRDGRPDIAAPMPQFVTVLYGAGAFPCPADLDGDGALTFFDYLAFLNAFNAGQPPADCDGDGDLTAADFLCFAAAFAAGC